MHVYVYEARLDNNKFHQTLAKIETRLTDLGLNGKIIRLNPMHNLERTIRDEAKADRTIVLVGGDALVNSALSILHNYNLPIGIIPIGKENNSIALSLGIESEEMACDTLAARRIIQCDLGLVNDAVFINQLLIKTDQALIDIQNNLNLEINSKSTIQITNLLDINIINDFDSLPDDGLLELTIEIVQKKSLFGRSNASHSYIQNDEFLINGNCEGVIDNCKSLPAPLLVKTLKGAIKIIVGKKRF
jgi:hypothetical protein